MIEQLHPTLVQLFGIIISALAMAALTFVTQYLRKKAKAEHLFAIEIGESILRKHLQDAIHSAEEYAHALDKEGASAVSSQNKLVHAIDYAVDAIGASPLPNMARDEVEKLIRKELGHMRANGQKG